jgi:hypothetical protein
VQIAITIAIENLIRIDRDPNFILKSIRDFSGKIAFSLFGFDALWGSANAPPPPRGHPHM